ncbi:uncharacterized protein Z518_09538 [Rhinocladiella mackenziei CBS 650.93]|uniref:Autophagy-related protein 14 n=1 Tax=Rhinocladiella mackenziei CBS 650.93 TaxID=1442369 RepID=A0A0D2IEX5_9EURO|nr:uncharacterized protein Z518_09538 [Rhinocladiella mackenziei CBS 650.93]KIX01811.1 hypothetical protein Z518_09538 [Rhinocladiella mackenziei CBS 650.93]
MDCSICKQHPAADGGMHCITCARNMLYGVRNQLAHILLQKEELRRKVEAIVRPELDTSKPIDEETTKLREAWQHQQSNNDGQRLQEEKEEMERQIQEIQKDTEEKQAQAKAVRERLAEKRANLEIAKHALATKGRKKLQDLEDACVKQEAQNDALHNKTVEAKATLCREAATLLRLRHSKRKAKDGTIKDRYSLGGLVLPDLKEINNMRCTELSAVLGHATRLVYLCAFYIGIRLPAEITLPRRDYPLPTINTPLTSYFDQRIPFPGTGSSLSAPSSPTASRMDLSSFPRPRPLFIGTDDHNESVVQLAKKEPLAFNFFLEGISLLAWDIAWLSRTQGFVAGTETWEDICDIGRNLYQMILAPQQSAATFRVLTQREIQNRQRPSPENPPVPGRLGSTSHTSAHTFLGRANDSADNPSRSWRLNKYTMVADPLKKHLLVEMNNAEWELLDEQEWDDGGEKMDEAVFIKAKAMDGKDYDDARSIMTTAAAAKVAGVEEDNARAKGKSGWTKVKSREKP